MLVFLTEEESITPVLQKLMQECHPKTQEGVEWIIQSYQGKADLEKNFSQTVKNWNWGDPHFILIRDNDGADCLSLKGRLSDKMALLGKPFHIRVVCQELEAWFLGDLLAVETAYPQSKASSLSNKSPYRKPDLLTNASELFDKIVNIRGKVGRSKLIAPFLDIDNNSSKSFQVIRDTIKNFNL